MPFALEQSHVNYLKSRNLDVYPEGRLKTIILPAVQFPIGIFWYAWTGNYPRRVPWIGFAVGGLVSGFGLMDIILSAYICLMEFSLWLAPSYFCVASLPLLSVYSLISWFTNWASKWGGTFLGCLGVLGTIILYFG